MIFQRLTKFFLKRGSRGRYEIDPDEIFLDSRNLPDFDVHQFEGRIEKPIGQNIFRGVSAVFVLIGLVFMGKLGMLQIVQGEAFETRSENNSLQRTSIFAERGVIYDRNKTELAWNDLKVGDDFATRHYIPLEGFSHLVGYVKYPSKDSSGNYYNNSFVGKTGVESYFDQRLTGKNGIKLTETDVLGKVQSESTLTPPTDGDMIMLSVDTRVQNKLFEIIQQTATDRGFTGGAGVIMDVNSGEILALTSFPEFNQDILTSGTDKTLVSNELNKKGTPFLDRVTSGLYIPGSIMKPYIAMGVLTENIIDPKKQILSTGSISIPNPYDPKKFTVFHDWEAHGWIDMRQALSQSSDDYFYTVGGGNNGQKGLGILGIEKYVRMFGFGTTTGLNLFGEQDGSIPSPEWKAATFNGEPWRLGDTFNSSIGQYGFQVTPIQAVRAVATFGNGGYLVVPTVLKNDNTRAKQSVHIPLSLENYQIVREGMRLSASEGVAKGLNVPGLPIAAKTGTAELGITKQFVNSWVTGYFPYEHPRYAFAVLMERGPRGNGVGATFVMRTLLDWMIVHTPEYVQ